MFPNLFILISRREVANAIDPLRAEALKQWFSTLAVHCNLLGALKQLAPGSLNQ
jgi:hypothetical protein